MYDLVSCRWLLMTGLLGAGAIGCAPWMIGEPHARRARIVTVAPSSSPADCRLDRPIRSADEPASDDPALTGADGAAPPDAGKRHAPDAGKRDTPDTGKRDASDTGKGDASDTGEGDASDTGKGDASDTGKGDAPGAGKRHAPGAGKRHAPGAGKRHAPGAGKRDTPDATERDAPDAGEGNTSDTGGRDVSGTGDAVVSPAAHVVQSSSAQVAFDFFVSKGLTTAQAAGIVGNLMQESGVNPTARQSDGPGQGIAQWSVGGRWNNLLGFAKARRASPLAVTTQLEFLWHELTTIPAYGLGALRAAQSVAAATRAFEKHFEVCGACNEPRRIAFAQAALRAYGNRAPRQRA